MASSLFVEEVVGWLVQAIFPDLFTISELIGNSALLPEHAPSAAPRCLPLCSNSSEIFKRILAK